MALTMNHGDEQAMKVEEEAPRNGERQIRQELRGPIQGRRLHRSFLTDISSEMLFNLLPIYLFSVLGVHTGLIGIIEGVADSAASLLKMVSGWLSDRLGRRKALAVLGYALSSIMKPFLYFATTWGGVLAVRFGDRLGKGLRTAPRDALVADSVRADQRGYAFGLHRAGDTAGAVIGLGLALAIVLGKGGIKTGLSRSTFQTIVILSMIPAVSAVFVLAFGAKENKPKAQSSGSAQHLEANQVEAQSRLVDIVHPHHGGVYSGELIRRIFNLARPKCWPTRPRNFGDVVML